MSHNWKVGDKFIRVVRNPGLGTHGEVGYQGTVVKLERNMGGGVGAVIDEAGRYHRTQFIRPLYDRKPEHPARPVRSTDPDTSKAAANPNRTPLRERVAIVINGGHYEPRQQGWTGHELAAQLQAPLNSVTPRLAELRRTGRIKDSGQRRDGQIVWVVA